VALLVQRLSGLHHSRVTQVTQVKMVRVGSLMELVTTLQREQLRLRQMMVLDSKLVT